MPSLAGFYFSVHSTGRMPSGSVVGVLPVRRIGSIALGASMLIKSLQRYRNGPSKRNPKP